MLGLAGVGTRLGDLRQQGLGGREVAHRGALDGIAGECLKLKVRQRHVRPLASRRLAGNQARQNGFAASNLIWPGVRPRSRMVRSSSSAMSRRERARRYHSSSNRLGRLCFITLVNQTRPRRSIRQVSAISSKEKGRQSTGRLRSRPPASVRRTRGPGRVKIRPGSGIAWAIRALALACALSIAPEGLVGLELDLAFGQAEVAQRAAVELGKRATLAC